MSENAHVSLEIPEKNKKICEGLPLAQVVKNALFSSVFCPSGHPPVNRTVVGSSPTRGAFTFSA
jgi:hypothetical protein